MLSSDKNTISGLFLREWIAIAIFFGFIMFISSVSLLTSFGKSPLQERAVFFSVEKMLKIQVLGEVKKEGIYRMKPGSTVNDLLKICPVKSTADRKKIPLKKVFYSSQSIYISKK